MIKSVNTVDDKFDISYLSKDIDLSIIIPCWNKSNFTKACLEDLVKLDLSHEIIIVDNGSTDNTSNILYDYNKKYDNVKYITHEKNLGFAKGCNSGFNISSGEFVMFLNNDIRVQNNHSNWTKDIIDFLQYNNDYIVGPTGCFVDKNCNFLYETDSFDKDINYISGWCISARKSTWKKLDISGNNEIFSEEFGYGYFEDTDLGFRCGKHDIKFKIIPVPVRHFGNITAKQLGVRPLYNRSKKIFAKKWRNQK